MIMLKHFQYHIARRNRQEVAKYFSKMENLFDLKCSLLLTEYLHISTSQH